MLNDEQMYELYLGTHDYVWEGDSMFEEEDEY